MTRADRSSLILLLAGFVAWSVAFVVLYGLQALGCAYAWPQHRAILIGAYVVAVLALGWLAMLRPSLSGEPATTLAISAIWANRAALAAGILVFLPVTFASTCL